VLNVAVLVEHQDGLVFVKSLVERAGAGRANRRTGRTGLLKETRAHSGSVV
jgi:hypothetical protein